ncbi:MAG: YhfC family intramembrane metalloprotease [Oscillospiraceae bacterium]|nr:YhfC family intramembrane metalloprotease [Oscillospiraceae bacterium]
MDGITGVPALNMAGMVLSLLVSLAAVIAAFVYGRKKLRAPVASFFVGVGTFVLFALVLESLLHNLIYPTSVGQKIWGDTRLYALYGGAAAALFEETGRIFAARTFLRRRCDSANAYMYGAGHGGVEALYVGVITQISNLSLAAMVNAGKAADILAPLSGAQYDAAAEQLKALCGESAGFFLAGYERVLAVAVHICLSLILFRGLRERRAGLVVLCYGLHFVLDAVIVLISRSFGLIAAEAFCTVFVLLAVLLTALLAPLPPRGKEAEAA